MADVNLPESVSGVDPTMPQTVREFYNTSGSTIAAGIAVALDTAALPGVKLPAAASKLVVGITLNAIPSKKSGLVVVDGLALGTAGGAVAAGDKLKVDAAGKLVSGGVFSNYVGAPVDHPDYPLPQALNDRVWIKVKGTIGLNI
jgi:hypothetical protein